MTGQVGFGGEKIESENVCTHTHSHYLFLLLYAWQASTHRPSGNILGKLRGI